MIYQIAKKITNHKSQITNPEAGVTLVLGILILAAVMAISFSLATILFIEVRSSADLLKSEASIYASGGVGEQALFNINRSVSNPTYVQNFSNGVVLAEPPAVQHSASPIFPDKVPPGSYFNSTYNKYDFCDLTSGSSGCQYGKVTLKYISTGGNDKLHAYLCEWDPNPSNPTQGSSGPCSQVSQTGSVQTYWKSSLNGSFDSDGGATLSPDDSVSWSLDSSLQQELILTNPCTSCSTIYVSLSTFADQAGNVPKGLPYVGKTAVSISTQSGSVGRKIQVVVPVGAFSGSGSGAPSSGYLHYRTISVNGGQVSGTQSSFPVLIKGTYAYLANVVNGGEVQSAGGADIKFTDSSGSLLPYEQEKYVAATGEIVYWVMLPSLADSTTFRMYYDNSSATDESNKAGVWDGNYKGIWHLPNGSTLTANDSTSGATNGTITGASPIAGQIDGGASFNGSTDGISMTDNFPLATTDLTISFWIKNTGHSFFSTIVAKGNTNDTSSHDWSVTYNAGNNNIYLIRNGNNVSTSNGSIPNAWTYFVGTMSPSSSKIYFNGALDSSQGGIGIGNTYNTSGRKVNFMNNSVNASGGGLDEVRVSNSVRSPEWITTEYNNQSSPGSFYSIGLEN